MKNFTITYEKTDGTTDFMVIREFGMVEAMIEFDKIQETFTFPCTRYAIISIVRD